jgi:hypothetical protein
MPERCPDCDALIALVGLRHRCIPKPKQKDPTKRLWLSRYLLRRTAGEQVERVEQTQTGAAERYALVRLGGTGVAAES